MAKIPKFRLYGEDDPHIGEAIQPRLALRKWDDLEGAEKEIALQELTNKLWITSHSEEVLRTIEHLNTKFLRQVPGKNLHRIVPDVSDGRGNEYDLMEAALKDFKYLFLNGKSEAMVLRMLSTFAASQIDWSYLKRAQNEEDEQKRDEYVEAAFNKLDRLANCLNHIFDQFSVNVLLTRNGLVPKQDDKITEQIYEPTLRTLSDPKWKTVNDALARMFGDYHNREYSEVITKAHSVVQRFLQILVGAEGKGGKGEIGKLFAKAKSEGAIPVDRFTEPMVGVFQSFFASQRATKSTAKPALKDATSSDALLMMNVVMVFLQHCLQNTK